MPHEMAAEMQQELELAPEIERRSIMEEQLCAVRGLAPQAPAGPGEAPLPSWEGGVTDAAAAAPGGAGELDGAGESLAYLLSTGDGGLDVSKLYALAMGAHGADELAGRVRAKADSIKQRLRERREYEDLLKPLPLTSTPTPAPTPTPTLTLNPNPSPNPTPNQARSPSVSCGVSCGWSRSVAPHTTCGRQ